MNPEFLQSISDDPTVVESYHEQDRDTGEYYLVEILSDGNVNVTNAEEEKVNY